MFNDIKLFELTSRLTAYTYLNDRTNMYVN